MSKPICIIRAPITTRSGYGGMARDIVRHFIESDRFEVLIDSVPWGITPTTALNYDDPLDKMLVDRIMMGIVPWNLPSDVHEAVRTRMKAYTPARPDVFVSITVPHEFQPLGKYNIGITAGIETSVASLDWVAGCERMDTVWVISEHAKTVFEFSKYAQKDDNGNVLQEFKITKPMEVLHNCINPKVIKKLPYEVDLDPDIRNLLKDIPEDFNFLFVGHWLGGDLGQDRKNIAGLVSIFLQVFKRPTPFPKPGLILKVSQADFSILDQRIILDNLEAIKRTIPLEDGEVFPNIYLIHGELTDVEMNSLYNHPKVKAHISLTRGEGFGRPLLEASISGKPVIASGWSGHMDFLNPEDALLIGGELAPVHPSAVMDKMILKEATWLNVDYNHAATAMVSVIREYPKYRKLAAKLGKENARKFSYDSIKARTIELIDKYVRKTPVRRTIILPALKPGE